MHAIFAYFCDHALMFNAVKNFSHRRVPERVAVLLLSPLLVFLHLLLFFFFFFLLLLLLLLLLCNLNFCH